MTFARYENATRCSGSAQPGARALMKYLVGNVPGARSLGIYSCLAGETTVVTPDGDIPIRDLSGTTATILTVGGARNRARWVQAPIRSYGEQPLMEVVLQRGCDREIVHATAEHRWITRYRRSGTEGGGHGHTEKTTADLSAGDVVPSVFPYSGASRIRHFAGGIPHGIVYGDGSIDNTGGARIALFGSKKMPLAEYFPNQVSSIGQRPGDSEPYAVITGLSRTWKSMPSFQESSAYLYGFLAGWFAADGRVTDSGAPTLYCIDRDALEQARLLTRRIGIGTYPLREGKSGGNVIAGRWVDQRAICSLGFVMAHLDSSFFLIPAHRERFNAAPNGRRPADWRVVSVAPTDRVETVYCAEVPETENFVIGEHVLTGNCRAVRGGGTRSIHSEGRALDVAMPTTGGRGSKAGHSLVQTLRADAAALGIQCIIYDRRIWSARSPGKNGRAYGGVNPHYDHLHIELTRSAASKLTVATARSILGGVSVPPVIRPKPETGKRLPVLSKGDRHALVPVLKRFLGEDLADDDLFGSGLHEAVRAYQRKQKLTVDGVVGKNTWTRISTSLKLPAGWRIG